MAHGARWWVAVLVGCAAPRTAPVPAAAPAQGWEGFYQPQDVTPAWLRAKGIALERVDAPWDRVAKLVMALPERTVPVAERERLRAFYCAAPEVRVWNAALCDALDAARCDAGSCTYAHHGNCTGMLAGGGLLVTAAHCLAELLDAPDRLAASHALLPGAGGVPRRVSVALVATGKREFQSHWVSTQETPVDVGILRVDDGGLPAHPRARVAPGEVVFMVGYPRAERRSERARTEHGYRLVAGTLALAVGRVADVNPENAPLCSVDGRQEHWALHQPCPAAQVTVDGEPAYTGVLLTRVFTSTMDSINGFSGAPVFHARGAWVGINSTVLSSENPQEVYPPGFRAVATHVEDALAAVGVSAR